MVMKNRLRMLGTVSQLVIKKCSKGLFFSNPTVKIRSDCVSQGIGCCSI